MDDSTRPTSIPYEGQQMTRDELVGLLGQNRIQSLIRACGKKSRKSFAKQMGYRSPSDMQLAFIRMFYGPDPTTSARHVGYPDVSDVPVPIVFPFRLEPGSGGTDTGLLAPDHPVMFGAMWTPDDTPALLEFGLFAWARDLVYPSAGRDALGDIRQPGRPADIAWTSYRSGCSAMPRIGFEISEPSELLWTVNNPSPGPLTAFFYVLCFVHPDSALLS